MAENTTSREELIRLVKIHIEKNAYTKPEVFSDTLQLAGLMNQQLLKLAQSYDNQYAICDWLYKLVVEYFRRYQDLCEALGGIPESYFSNESFPDVNCGHSCQNWQKPYHQSLANDLINAEVTDLPQMYAYLQHSLQDIQIISSEITRLKSLQTEYNQIIMSETGRDLYGCFVSLYKQEGYAHPLKDKLLSTMTHMQEQILKLRVASEELLTARVKEFEQNKEVLSTSISAHDSASGDTSGVGSEKVAQLNDALHILIRYAQCDQQIKADFENAFIAFRNLKDKTASTSEALHIRKNLTAAYYPFYKAVFLTSMEGSVPVIVRMFLQFGFVDTSLVGMETAEQLYDLGKAFHGNAEKGIYTMYEWLSAIYHNHKNPSINEFEEDYERYLKKRQMEDHLSEDEIYELWEDPIARVSYELENMLPSACKITSGRPSIFCPVLCDFQFLKKPAESILRPASIIKVLEQINSLDYGLFYREVMTVLSESEHIHEFIHMETMPDIILSPVCGSRGAMWQDLTDHDKKQPARFILPVFQQENLSKILLHICAEFRWESCKRAQGARWNDVSDPSLTSLYCDYLQFYRKNTDLSPAVKDKIKLLLQKCKQNFKECFAYDYMTYMLYESNGAPHLNKVSRYVLMSFIPFSKEIRMQLKSNPIFAEPLEKYDLKTGQKLKKLDNMYKKFAARGKNIPEELETEIEYYQM